MGNFISLKQMKQVFATAAVAGVTSALSIRDMYNKFVYG